MNQEKKSILIKYIVCFCVASLITVIVFWIKGFFTGSTADNIQVLSDGFTVSGLLLLMFAGMMYVSGEGALVGITYVFKSVVLWFIPGGKLRQETYKVYRERKLSKTNKSSDHCVSLTGLLFFVIGVIFTVIWYTNFYNIV